MPQAPPIVHTVHVVARASGEISCISLHELHAVRSLDVKSCLSSAQKPNAHYDCFDGDNYAYKTWSGPHTRWCCYKYKEDRAAKVSFEAPQPAISWKGIWFAAPASVLPEASREPQHLPPRDQDPAPLQHTVAYASTGCFT